MPVRILLLFISILIFSCNRNTENISPDVNSADETIAQAEPLPSVSTDSIAEKPSGMSLPEIIPWEKKLIKNATLTVEVGDFKSFNNGLHTLVTQYSGYIASEKNTYANLRNESEVTIKVPVMRFEELLNQLNNKAIKTIERNISTQDVTGEMKDIKARLETKKETRLKYLEFLKKSKNINEVLKVQNEINELQEQIESMNSTHTQMSHQTTFSTIQLTFYSVILDHTQPSGKPGFADRFVTSIRSGISIIGEFLILLARLWPFIFIASVTWLVLRKKKLLKI